MTNLTHIPRTLLQLLFLSLLISFALGINYLSAWNGPPAGTPPVPNAAAPINVGTTNQVKDANLSVGHSANTASDFGLVSYGKIRSTIGGIQFPDGTVQTTSSTIVCTTSSEIAISGTAAKTWNHGLGARPTLMMPYLVNKIAEKGYSVGDEFYLGAQTGDGTSVAGIGLVPNSTSVTIIFPSTTVNVGLNVTEFILNKTGGPYSYITNANWRLVVRACVL